ncbi:MerR family transcriptional regulator [Agromyces soli]|uniref:MerR family transcriptional regulator n=1 Tax=Agromyces soli TaxID=659012 RepID=A0ABY4ASZ6_9MICO|nr:MerR family transcriptional regulator [Agromyces soli]UOE26282.1 MerR family transcriptional regulator [Agromyces soli]
MARELRTAELARAAGYSDQQVRDLERLGVIPPAARSANGYRSYTGAHLVALRAYRALALAIGPVAARAALAELRTRPLADAAAVVDELHAGISRERERVRAALAGLAAIATDASAAEPSAETMSITELAAALGVRSSTLRFWEAESLLSPDRVGSVAARSYPPPQIVVARIVAALREGGAGIPEVRAVVDTLGEPAGVASASAALDGRLRALAARSAKLLRASAALVELIEGLDTAGPSVPSAPSAHRGRVG